jgi:hypothetical protein
MTYEYGEPRWKYIDRTGRKTCRNASLSTTNPTRTDRGTNPGLCGERQETNRLSHGTAFLRVNNNNNNNNVLANRPDIRMKNKKDKTCLLIDVAIPSDKNVIKRKLKRN